MPIDQLDSVERYLLLLLYAPDSTDKFTHAIRGRTWLQKEMFLLSKFVPDLEKQADYDANMMGYFSQIVDEVEDQLYISELLERPGEGLKLSLEGMRLAEEVWRTTSDSARRLVTGVKTLLNDLSQIELLGFIYSEYPETAIDSDKREEVEANRIDIAIGLLQKGKVPLEKAANIARQSVDEFIRTLGSRGISMSDIETKNIMIDRVLLEQIEQSKEESKRGQRTRWETIRQHQ